MLDPSIPLSVKNFDVQPVIKNYQDEQMQSASLRDMAQQRDIRAEQLKSAQLQSAEQARQSHEDQTLRGLAQINNLTTSEGQNQFLQDTEKLGFGHKIPEFAATFASQRAAAAKAKQETEKAERQTYLDRLDLRSRILSTATDEPSYQTALGRLSKVGDDLSGLEKNFDQDKVKSHIDEVLSHKESLENQLKNKALDAKIGEKAAISEADFAFREAIPELKAKISQIGADAIKKNQLVADIYKKFGKSPLAIKFVDDIKNNTREFMINANQTNEEDETFFASQLANGKMTPMEISAMYSSRGGNKSRVLASVFEKAEQINPEFSPAQAKISMKQAEDVTNNRTIALIDAALPNFGRLKTLSDKISRLPIKSVTHAALAASRQFNDEDLALFDTMKILQTDEINQIFAAGKGGSDMSRKMAADLINETLPPKAFGKAIDTVYETMLNKKKAIKGTMGLYGKNRGLKDEAEKPKNDPLGLF